MKRFTRTLHDGREVDVEPAETAGQVAARDGTLTFRAFAAEWSSRRGYQLVRARANDYRLKLVYDFALPDSSPTVKTIGNISKV